MAYRALQEENRLPDPVKRLVLEYTGPRKQWAETAKKEVIWRIHDGFYFYCRNHSNVGLVEALNNHYMEYEDICYWQFYRRILDLINPNISLNRHLFVSNSYEFRRVGKARQLFSHYWFQV